MDVAAVLAELTEFLREVRKTAEIFGLSKWELYGTFILVIVAWRLPTILGHRKEMASLMNETELQSKKLSAAIEDKRAKRERKALNRRQK